MITLPSSKEVYIALHDKLINEIPELCGIEIRKHETSDGAEYTTRVSNSNELTYLRNTLFITDEAIVRNNYDIDIIESLFSIIMNNYNKKEQ